ncbi:MAG: HD domain-containing protein [Thermodesulfobacteriota bacterium]|nr:MAG: HD domain-containing protein [Thermodesulfobacteriota bacterium]
MSKEVIDSLRTLHDLSKAINSTLKSEEVVSLVLEKTSNLMKTDKVLILLLGRPERVLTVQGYLGFKEGELPVKRFPNVKSFDHCIVHKGTVITFEEILPEQDYRELIHTAPMLADMVFAPLEIQGSAYGLLGVLGRKSRFSPVELEIFCAIGSQSAVAMENANLYRKLKDTFLHTAEALAEAVNSRDPYTGGHTRRVVDYSLLIADRIGLSEGEKETLRLAAILHDIGKIGIDDAILRKGGVLTEAEDLKMREHPSIGARILGYVDEMVNVIPGVYNHHEWFDGSGYPEGLKGEKIPLQARIIAIADAYDALTTDRPYRKAMDRWSALDELAAGAGSHFDPSLADTFARELRRQKER